MKEYYARGFAITEKNSSRLFEENGRESLGIYWDDSDDRLYDETTEAASRQSVGERPKLQNPDFGYNASHPYIGGRSILHAKESYRHRSRDHRAGQQRGTVLLPYIGNQEPIDTLESVATGKANSFEDEYDDNLFPKPKRPRTAYNFFVQKVRSKIVENMKSQKSSTSEASPAPDDVNFSSIGKSLGEKWHNLDQESKAQYKNRAKRDIERYAHKMKEYYSKNFLHPNYGK
mmetsp:Transcript_16710/g.23821  ORF Transcript_16710/g.23821 Transcript_16710/m.23821 type:complete len:231 (-) Transcript_16710:2114-2806(-)